MNTTTTKPRPLYWNGNGKLQAEYDAMRLALVPAQGPATTTAGELLRLAGNIYYDVYNNGGGNIGDRSGINGPLSKKLIALLSLLEDFGYPDANLLHGFFLCELGRQTFCDDAGRYLDPMMDFAIETAARLAGYTV